MRQQEITALKISPDHSSHHVAAVDHSRKVIWYPGMRADPRLLAVHLHELGHVFSKSECKQRLSATKEFKAAYVKDREALSTIDILAFSYYLSHDRTGYLQSPRLVEKAVSALFGPTIAREECFAELFQEHVTTCMGKARNGALSCYMPRSAEVVARFHDQVFGMTQSQSQQAPKVVTVVTPAARPLTPAEREAQFRNIAMRRFGARPV